MLRVIITLSDYFGGKELPWGYEELIDTLISEGHQKVTLFCGRLRTDDELAEVHFITSENGDIVARNLHEAGGHSGWTLCDCALLTDSTRDLSIIQLRQLKKGGRRYAGQHD